MQQLPQINRLPLCFDPTRLAAEAAQFSAADWLPHPLEAAGDASLPLIAVGGTRNIDYAITGPMDFTHYLAQCPYLQQVLQTVAGPLSRCRLVRRLLRVGEPSNLLAEQNYHWFRRRPIYIPIVTDPALTFAGATEPIHLAAGEAWSFDPSMPHGFVYGSDTRPQGDQEDKPDDTTCIHLVIESKSSAALMTPLAQAGPIAVEPYTFEVLTPQELCKLMAFMLVEIRAKEIAQDEFAILVALVDRFQRQWQQAFARFGHHAAGELAYQALLVEFQEQIVRKAHPWVGSAGRYALAVIRSMLQSAPEPTKRLRPQFGQQIQRQRQQKSAQLLAQQETFDCPEFDRPLFIVSAPRAGSTLLFETLRQLPELWTTGAENHELIEEMPSLHPAAHDYHSNRLTAAAATPAIGAQLQQRFAQQLQNRTGDLLLACPQEERPTRVRFLEKTPKNALRIPFLKAVFPTARFLFLYREPGANISSMMEGWRAQRFVSYPALPGWPSCKWNFLLVPGWQALVDRPVAEIAAYQWQVANATILDDLAALPAADWTWVRYTDLVHTPKQTIQQIARFADLQWDEHIEQRVSQSLPTSSMTLSAPTAAKWRKHSWEIDPVLPALESIIQRVEMLEPIPTFI